MTVISDVHKILEARDDVAPVIVIHTPDGYQFHKGETYRLLPKKYPRDLALGNLRATQGFKIDRDPDMVDFAIASIRENEVFQRAWTSETWSEVEYRLKHDGSPLMQANRVNLDRFVSRTLLKPVTTLLKIHCGTYAKNPDPSFDRALECVPFVGKIEGTLGEASPYVIGMIYDDVNHQSLIELDGSTMLQTGRLSISADALMQSRTTLKRRMEAVEAVLLKAFSVAVEFNLSYLTILHLSGAVFIRVRGDRLTVGPFVPFEKPEEPRLPAVPTGPSIPVEKPDAPRFPKDAKVHRKAPVFPSSSLPEMVPSGPPLSSINSSSSDPSMLIWDSSEQPPLLLALTAMAYEAFHEKDWEPDQQWATLPASSLPEPRKRKARPTLVEESFGKKSQRLSMGKKEDNAAAVLGH